MNKVFTLGVIMALVLAGCSDTTTRTEIEEQETVLGFQAGFVDKSTKASYTTKTLLASTESMGVFGYKNAASLSNYVVFDNVKVTNNGSNVWSYSPLKYWDKMATSYNFYAYVPYSLKEKVSLESNSSTAFSITDFAQSSVVAEQTDILTDLETQKNVTGAAIGKKVEFTFHHILSNVNFKMAVSEALKNDETDNPVTVISVSLNEIQLQGDYAYGTDKYEWTVDADASKSAFAATATDGVVFAGGTLLATEATEVPGLTDMLMIPQNLPVKPSDPEVADPSYAVTITYTIGKGDGPTDVQEYTKVIPLTDFKNSSDESLSKWEPDCRYNYVLVIGSSPIQFGVTGVDTWYNVATYTYTIE